MPSPFERRSWVTSQRDRVEQAAARQMQLAGYSRLNWDVETRAAIAALALDAGRNALCRWEILPMGDRANVLHIRIHAPGLLRPASLIYSMHANGTIIATARGHDGRLNVVDCIERADRLAGTSGEARVLRQIETFRRISCATLATALPSVRDARFFRRLQRRTNRFAADQRLGETPEPTP